MDWTDEHLDALLLCAAAWVPFFDDMNAIIFLARISCFDQVLMEDTSVNRLVRVPTSRILFLDFSPSPPLGPPSALSLTRLSTRSHSLDRTVTNILILFSFHLTIGGLGLTVEVGREEPAAG